MVPAIKNNKMQEVKKLIDAASKKIDEELETTRQEALARINVLLDKMTGMADFQNLSENLRDELKKPFENQIEKIKSQDLIALIRDALRLFEDEEYGNLLNKLSSLCKSKDTSQKSNSSGSKQTKYNDDIEDSDFGKGETNEDHRKPGKKDPVKEVVGIKKIEVKYDKAWIENASEVDAYLSLLKEAVLKEIKNGKRIQV